MGGSMRLAKKILTWSAGLLLLAVASLVLAYATAGDDLFRWAVRQLIEDRVERQVTVDGSFTVEPGWEPTLAVTDVWIENAPWAEKPELARVGRAEVQLALGPLLWGIVQLPRLVLHDVTLALERRPDGTGNWDIIVPTEEPFIPVMEQISIRNVTATYRDKESGRESGFRIAQLTRQRDPAGAGFIGTGEGDIDGTPFRLDGRFGSVEQALDPETPFPVTLSLDFAGLSGALEGSVLDLPQGEGFDLALSLEAPSISRTAADLALGDAPDGRATARTRVTGALTALALEDLRVEILETSGQFLRAEGSLADLTAGEGLDLSVDAALGPAALNLLPAPPETLRRLLAETEELELTGRVAGRLAAPAVEDLALRFVHDGAAALTAEGRLALAFDDGGPVPSALTAALALSLADPAPFEQALDTRLPELGAVDVTAALEPADDRILLTALTVEAPAFESLRLEASGPLARHADDGLAFEPDLKVSAALDRSAPLVELLLDPTRQPPAPEIDPARLELSDRDLVLAVQQALRDAGFDPGPPDGLMGPRTRAAIAAYQAEHALPVDRRPSRDLLAHLLGAGVRRPAFPGKAELDALVARLAPVAAEARLTHAAGAFRLDDLRVTLGAREALWLEAAGSLAAPRPGAEAPVEDLALAVRVAAASSRVLAPLLPPDLPEITGIEGRFDLQGVPAALSLSDASFEAKGPADLAVRATGGIERLSLLPAYATAGLAFALEARAPESARLLQIPELGLPELDPPEIGELRARATLSDPDGRLGLSALELSVGPADEPVARAAGRIGDLLGRKDVSLSGDFALPAAMLLELKMPAGAPALGSVEGRFGLSDQDGTLGIDALEVAVTGTDLLTLTGEGIFDDMPRYDRLRLEAALEVPDVPALARALGHEVAGVGSLAFEGQIAGSDEFFEADGLLRVGKTEITGTLEGNHLGDRPVLKARLWSPIVYLADFGQPPAADDEEKPLAPGDPRLFDEEPFELGVIRDYDLDLDIELDEIDGLHFDVDQARARIEVVDGLLTVDPLVFRFIGGSVDIRLGVDARRAPPEMRIRVVADDLDIGDFLAQIEGEVPLDGELDMIVEVQGSGESPHALASSLDGTVNLAVAEGHVQTGLLDLTVTNPVRWLFSRSARRGYSELNCLVVRFEIDDGTADDVNLMLDTRNVRAEGTGDMDFGDENLDIDVSPRAKRRRLIAIVTPFEIEGPMTGPSVIVSKRSGAKRAIGQILVSPINLLGSIFTLVSDRGRDADNACLQIREITRAPEDLPE